MEPVQILIDQLRDIARSAVALSPQVFVALVLILITALVSKLVKSGISRVLRRTNLRQSLKELAILLVSIFVWVMGLMIAVVVVFPRPNPHKYSGRSGDRVGCHRFCFQGRV